MKTRSMPSRALLALVAVVAAALAGATAGAGAGATPTSAQGGKPARVTVAVIGDYTGPLESFLKEVRRGWDLRMKQARSKAGKTTVVSDFRDSRADPRAAANEMTQVADDDDIPIALYGTSSGIAPAIAPIAQREKLNMIAIFAGGPRIVETGNYIFRVTAPQHSYHKLMSTYFKRKKVKTVAIIYNDNVGTTKHLAEEVYPGLARVDGYRLVERVGISLTATDFSSEMTRVINAKSDAVVLLNLGAQITGSIAQLRRANFRGIIGLHPGVSIPGLQSLGADANGVIWPTDFTPATTFASGKRFVAAFRKEYGYEPEAFAASGYDAATMTLLALTRAKSFSREAVHRALMSVTKSGFASASGPLKFKGRDARVRAHLVEWRNGKQRLITAGR